VFLRERQPLRDKIDVTLGGYRGFAVVAMPPNCSMRSALPMSSLTRFGN
jgi:hypothetical protein